MNERTAVWMDGTQAKIFHVGSITFDEATVERSSLHVHRHPKDQLTRSHAHPDDEHRFFHEIAGHLAGSEQILLLGPSVAKLHFLRYLRIKAPPIEERVVGLETVGHPTDRQIAAHVREYFQNPAGEVGARVL